MGIKQVLQRDPRVEDIAVKRRSDAGCKCADILVLPKRGWVLQSVRTAGYHSDKKGTLSWIDLDVEADKWEADMRSHFGASCLHLSQAAPRC